MQAAGQKAQEGTRDNRGGHVAGDCKDHCNACTMANVTQRYNLHVNVNALIIYVHVELDSDLLHAEPDILLRIPDKSINFSR